MVISFDIAEGDYRNFYREQYEAQKGDKRWKGTYRLNCPIDSGDEKLDEKIEAITGAIMRKERQVKKIENILGRLTEEEGMLIEIKYFKRYTVNRICELLDITTDTFIKRRKKIIVKRLIPLFGN